MQGKPIDWSRGIWTITAALRVTIWDSRSGQALVRQQAATQHWPRTVETFCGRQAKTSQCAHLAPRTTCQLGCAGSVARQTLTA